MFNYSFSGNGLLREINQSDFKTYKGHIDKIMKWYIKYPATRREFVDYVNKCSENVISKQDKFKLNLFFEQNKSCKSNKNVI
jgi:hypothetical protein